MASGSLQVVDGDPWDAAESWEQMGTWSGPFAYSWNTPNSWSEMPNWMGRPGTTRLVYTDEPIDIGKRLQCYVMIDADSPDDVLVELRSSLDGVTWTAWGDATARIDARWVQVRATVTSTEEGEPPILGDLVTTIVAKVIEKVTSDIASAAIGGAARYGVGDVRVMTTAFLFIDAVNVTVRSPSTPVSIVVVDKDIAGPRIKFFDPAGDPVDVVFDIRMRGY